MHRIVAKEFIDNPENRSYVDHIDHNKQNNCVNNLRWCSIPENSMNMSKQQKPCSSHFKGVYYYKQYNKWRAQIKTNTGQKHHGYFSDAIDAARVYNDHAERLFGAFAHLNIL